MTWLNDNVTTKVEHEFKECSVSIMRRIMRKCTIPEKYTFDEDATLSTHQQLQCPLIQIFDKMSAEFSSHIFNITELTKC